MAFFEQLEESRRHLFGNATEPRTASDNAFKNSYAPPFNLKVIPCKEDVNGEWVPEKLEEKVAETI